MIPPINVYFIDTDYDEEEKYYIYEEKGQDTIDIMLRQMKLDVDMYHSINTTDLDMTVVNAKIRTENYKKEVQKLKKMIEEEKRKKEREEEKKKTLEEEIKRHKKNDEERGRKEKELEELIKKLKEERERLEEIERENIKKEEDYEKKRKMIEEEVRKKGIEIARLDNMIDDCGLFAKRSGFMVGISFLMCLGGLTLGQVIPEFGIFIFINGFFSTLGYGAGLLGSGFMAISCKIAKEVKK